MRQRKINDIVNSYEAAGRYGVEQILRMKAWNPIRIEFLRRLEEADAAEEEYDRIMLEKTRNTMDKIDSKKVN